MIIDKEFYNRSAIDVANDLLGKVLVREVDGSLCLLYIWIIPLF